MPKGNGNPGMNRLAQAIDERMRIYHGDITSDLKVDFGRIGNDWALTVESFDFPIPKGEYYVSSWLTGLRPDTTVDGYHAHTHKVNLPKLKKGDDVIVVWIGDEVCVIDTFVSSSSL